MQQPSLKCRPVKLGKRLHSIFGNDVGDESKPFDLSSVLVDGKVDLGQRSERLEQLF